MERSKLADLSEIVSSIAIVITLIYLTVEIRQNTSALNGQSRQAVLEAAQAELFKLMDNPDITMSMTKTEPLTAQEQIRLDNFYTAALRGREFSWLQYRDGSIDTAQWETELAVLKSIVDSRRSRLWWNNLGRDFFGPEFVAFVDDLMQHNEPTEKTWSRSADWAENMGPGRTDID